MAEKTNIQTSRASFPPRTVEDPNSMMVTQKSLFYYAYNGGGLPAGKYLLVSFYDFMFPKIEFYMFDTSPYGIVKTEEKKRAAEAARKKIQF